DFTLYRGADGEAHVVQSRCPHRGARLSIGWVEGDAIRCFYHGWKFSGTGQCIEQPGDDPRMARDVQVASHPTREYLGLIFSFLGEGAPPEFPRLDVFEQAPYRDVAGVPRRCSYFNQMEN